MRLSEKQIDDERARRFHTAKYKQTEHAGARPIRWTLPQGPHNDSFIPRERGVRQTSDAGDEAEILLSALLTRREPEAWRRFVARYSGLIYRIVHRYEAGDDRCSECYLYVCAALSDDDFRRLRKFQPHGAARFETWLRTVAANLCVDWRRKRDGRRRAPVAVQRLDELDQAVFRSIFVHGMTRHQCLERLRPRFTELTDAKVAAISARLFRSLSPRQRFLLSCPHAARGRAPEVDGISGEPTADAGADPAAQIADLQQQGRLVEALARLGARDQLLLTLRFEQGLTLVEVARLTGLPDPFRAQRQINSALAALRQLMEEPESDGRAPAPQTAPQCP